MNKNLISCPTPKQLESEDILEVQEDAQEYFDETIIPLLKLALHKPTPLKTPLRYGAYVAEALKSRGWQLRWDENLREDVIERKRFKLKLPKFRVTVTRPGLFAIAAAYAAVWIRMMILGDFSNPITPLFDIGGFMGLFAMVIYSITD